MQNPKKPIIKNTKELAQTGLFRVQQLELQFSNGQERIYERLLSHHKAVMIIPVLDENTILLVKEYGAGIDDYYLAFPKGVIDPPETPFEAANRELQEEVGYGAHHLELLKETFLSPAYMQRSMYLVVAQDLYPQKLEGDEPEPIEVVPWRLDQLPALLQKPEFCETASLAALLWLNGKKNGQF